jgi:RNA polymerase sigma-70 factor (ECF subfamily)
MGEFRELDLGPPFEPFIAFREQFGFVPNIFRAQCSVPALVAAEARLLDAVLFRVRALTRVQKECILLITAAANGNAGCLAIHYQMLRLLAVPEQQLEHLIIDPLKGNLSPPNQALVSFSLKVISGRAITMEDIGPLAKHGFSEVAVLEAVLAIALGDFLCTLSRGLCVAPDFPLKEFPAPAMTFDTTDEVKPSARWISAPERRAAGFPPFEFLQKLFGFIPSVFEFQTLLPDAVEAETELLRAVFRPSSLSPSLKGLIFHGEGRVLPTPAESVLLRFLEQPGIDGIQNSRQVGVRDEQIVEAVAIRATASFLKTLESGLSAPQDLPLRASDLRPAKKEHLLQRHSRQIEGVLVVDPDSSLVERIRAGDVDALEEVMNRHGQRVYRTLLGLLGDAEEAQDAMQDTFLKAFQHIRNFEGRSKFSTWLLSIASNTGVQRLRERRPMESLEESDFESHEGFRPRQIKAWIENPEQLYSQTEMRGLIERSILRLPAKYRVVLMLRDIEQLSTEDCAAAVNLGIPAFKARLLRGRLMLREALAPHFAKPNRDCAKRNAKGTAS